METAEMAAILGHIGAMREALAFVIRELPSPAQERVCARLLELAEEMEQREPIRDTCASTVADDARRLIKRVEL